MMQSSIDSRHPIKKRIGTNTLPIIDAFVPTYGGKQRRKKLKIHPIFIAILPWPSSSLPPFLPLSYQLARTSARAERGRGHGRGRGREGGRSESASNYATNRCCKNSQQRRRRLRLRCQKWLLRPRHSPSPSLLLQVLDGSIVLREWRGGTEGRRGRVFEGRTRTSHA